MCFNIKFIKWKTVCYGKKNYIFVILIVLNVPWKIIQEINYGVVIIVNPYENCDFSFEKGKTVLNMFY